ncbi:MAG: Toprim protein [Pseudomonadota bacterium]|nr:Toprim protein [Pseudomonadota bacterium]
MAIYYLSHGMVSRSSGRSSVQSAAYITGASLHESRRDLDISYKNRLSDIAFTDTLAPEHAPQQFHEIGVWDLLEDFEDEYAIKRFPNCLESRDKYLNSAQTAQTIVIALPRELEVGAGKELVEEFAKERFVSRGLIVTYAIHDDEGNPHAHLQISRRAVNEKGELAWAKDREVVSRKELLVTRKLWADLSNKYLEREGFEARITEKSYADLGINLEPSLHRGWVSDKLGAMGINSYVMAENAARFARNKEMLIERPFEILPELTSKAATFTQSTLLKAIQKRVGDDDKIVAQVFEGALQHAIVVGEGMNGEVRYTTQSYKDIEEQAVNKVSELMATSFEQRKLSKDSSNEYIESNFAYLSQEQKETVLGLTQDQSLAVLIGRAGAGKTTTLKVVSEIYQNSGYKVIGASLAALAAQNLEAEAGIKATTIHSWLYKWDRYQAAQEKFLSFNNVMEEGLFKQLKWYKDLQRYQGSKLTKDTVLIVDEAGMVGTRQWGELLTHVQKAGSKLIVVGDDNQFKAIEAGDFFRELKVQAAQQTQDQNSQTTNLFSLQEIRRQQQSWMREASHQLAELNISEGLSTYEQYGHLQQTSRANLSEDIATAYLGKLKADLSQTGLVLAFTNAQTNSINQAIREQLKQEGMIGKEDLIKLNGQNFAIGDRIVFLKNDKTWLTITDADGVAKTNASIKNGTQGSISGVDNQGNIKVQLADNCYTIINTINRSPKVAIGQPQPEPIREYTYTNIQHGYAVTCHKSQGQTVDFTIIAASKHMDAKGLYVAMTRHRDDVRLFYAKEEFTSFKALTSQLSRFDHKDLVKDYTIRPENEASWQRVQEYRLCALDAAAVIKGQSNVDWQAYNQIKQDQVCIGKEILQDFSKHQLYVNQAGLTQEMLQISTGQKTRPLSLVESKAKVTVELYGETANAARQLWQAIRKTHPVDKCYQHTSYPAFKGYQQERNALAHTISQNYPLHREFINQFNRQFGINQKTVEAQSKQFIQSQSTDKYSEKTDQIWYNNRLDNINYGKYTTSTINLNPSKDQLNSEFQAQNIEVDRYQKSLDAKFIKQELNANIKDLAYEFLGKPHIQKTTEWRYGNKGSISIHVAGTKQGLYSNFETGESGNALKFIADQLNCDHKQAFKWGAEWLGKDHVQGIGRTAIIKEPQQLPQAKQEWTTIYPAPKDYVDLKASSNSNLAYMLKGRQETNRYAYKDADSNILGYVVRLEDKQGNKITPTLTYCRNQEGKEQWRWQGFGNDRPLYGLDQLKQKPDAPVLIVEGEKTAEAAKALLPEYAVVTWSGGCGAVQKSDWTVLKDRDVTVWPDNDKPGFNAAVKIADLLNAQGNQETKIVDLPPTLPHKWDLADKVPEGIKIKEILVNAVEQIAGRTTPKFLETAHAVNQITQEANTDQATRTIGIEDIYKHCKNHYMGYRITPENTEFIVKVTNDTYQELQQWTSLSGFSADDSKLEVQAALTAVYADMFKTITKQRHNALDKSIDIGKIAGKIKMDMGRANLQEDKAIVLSASRLYDKQDKEMSAIVQSKDISGYTQVVHKEILKATTRCHSMTGDYLSKEMTERLLGETKMTCGMENDSQKAKAAIGEICARLAMEASPTVDRPLTIQQQREKSVVDYISAELNSKNNSLISGSTDAFLKSKLVKDPMGALETWKTFTNNQNCFTPMSFAEMQIKTQEANALLESQKANMTEEVHDKLKATISTNPQEVIQQCRGVIEFQLDKARQADINKYTELSKAFLKLPYNDREDSSAAKELNEIANRHQNDEKFNQAITKNDITRQVQQSLHEPNKLEIHRGFER